MSSKYRSRIRKKKTKKLRGGGLEETVQKVESAVETAKPYVQKARQAVRAVRKAAPVVRQIARKGKRLGKSLLAVAHSNDMQEFKHRSLHSYHHAHSFINHATPHVLHAHRAVANILAGGGVHPFHGNIRPKDFHDFRYGKDVPRAAYLDIARSDRESLRDALEDEYHDHSKGKSGGGLFHALNATAAASAHWARKQHARGKDLHARLKRDVPKHFHQLKRYTAAVQHGAEWVRDQIETNHTSFQETAGLFASSNIKPFSALGEKMTQMDHHIDGLHSLTGHVADYASKAHQTMEHVEKEVGGSLKGKIKSGATVARKGLRTVARVADATAAPASMLGLATENPFLLSYGSMAPIVSEAATLGARGLGQAIKTL